MTSAKHEVRAVATITGNKFSTACGRRTDDRLRREISSVLFSSERERCRARCVRVVTTTPRCACDSLLHGCGVATIKFAGNEGSVAPVGHPAKQEATRMSQPKQAMRLLQGSSAPTEVAERKSSIAHCVKVTIPPPTGLAGGGFYKISLPLLTANSN